MPFDDRSGLVCGFAHWTPSFLNPGSDQGSERYVDSSQHPLQLLAMGACVQFAPSCFFDCVFFKLRSCRSFLGFPANPILVRL